MSGRCRSCDCIMSEEDMKMVWPGTKEYSDLCGFCFHIAIDPDNVDYYETPEEVAEGFQVEE